MEITVKGQKEILETGAKAITVTDLLKLQKVEMPEMVSVELNGTIVARSDFDLTEISQGDSVEFLYFMGGGSGRFRK